MVRKSLVCLVAGMFLSLPVSQATLFARGHGGGHGGNHGGNHGGMSGGSHGGSHGGNHGGMSGRGHGHGHPGGHGIRFPSGGHSGGRFPHPHQHSHFPVVRFPQPTFPIVTQRPIPQQYPSYPSRVVTIPDAGQSQGLLNKMNGGSPSNVCPSYSICQQSCIAKWLGSKAFWSIYWNAQKSWTLGNQNWWFSNRPRRCHWWYNSCPTLWTCAPQSIQSWDFGYCSGNASELSQAGETRWYLGITGIIIPGVGFGIESVEPGSPADMASLQPGMVLTSINNQSFTDEVSMLTLILESNGVLQVAVLDEALEEPQALTIQLVDVPVQIPAEGTASLIGSDGSENLDTDFAF